MTDPDDEPQGSKPTDREAESPELDSAAVRSVRDLLRGAAEQDEEPVPDVLRGVQRKIRERSGGKYFADGWSTARQPPISTFLVTSLVMLTIVVIVYLVLRPLASEPVKVEPPAPVNVIPPER